MNPASPDAAPAIASAATSNAELQSTWSARVRLGGATRSGRASAKPRVSSASAESPARSSERANAARTIAVVEGVAARRGFRIKGGDLDFEKGAHTFLQDYRTGTLGRISLETPVTRAARLAKHDVDMAEKARIAAEKAALKAANSARGKRGT